VPWSPVDRGTYWMRFRDEDAVDVALDWLRLNGLYNFRVRWLDDDTFRVTVVHRAEQLSLLESRFGGFGAGRPRVR
jgi:hypothetical protein